jgi:hypothetical protein
MRCVLLSLAAVGVLSAPEGTSALSAPEGTSALSAPEGTSVLSAPGPAGAESAPGGPATMTLFPDTPAGRLSRAWMGCHLDEGFTQQTFSWSRSVLVSHSFESYHSFAVQAWSDATDAGVTGSTLLDNSTQVNPNARVPSLKVTFQSGAGVVGSANRGMGGEGLALASAPYDGFAVVLAPGGGSLYVALRPRGGGAPLSSATLTKSLPWRPGAQP